MSNVVILLNPLVLNTTRTDARPDLLPQDLAALKNEEPAMVKGLVKSTLSEVGVTIKQDSSPKRTSAKESSPDPSVS